MHCFFISKQGHICGQNDLTRLNSLKGFKKFLTKIFKRYKNKFIDIKPFECYETN